MAKKRVKRETKKTKKAKVLKNQKLKKKKQKLERKIKKKNLEKNKTALVLGVIAVIILIANSLYILIAKEKLVTEFQKVLETSASVQGQGINFNIAGMLITFAVIWLVFAILIAYTIYLLEKKKFKGWYYLLILGILVVFSARLLAGVLAIISSIVYKKQM